ncbi:YbaB/EbfC family nucleoid-associated protein [Nonomuraea sp. bgisy101]|uniref:YbaB/EbfC family nucleoid-associated protein n=1 Tax=Nonomuraea sp. bgisy101 TaxID=3413784 RepID=UPI003D74D306
MKRDDAFDPVTADIGRLVHEIAGHTEAIAATMRELEHRKLTGSDGTAGVTATVSGTGQLLEVLVTPLAMRELDHVELAEAVREAIDAARVAMADELTEAMNAVTGELPQPDPDHDPFARYLDDLLRG